MLAKIKENATEICNRYLTASWSDSSYNFDHYKLAEIVLRLSCSLEFTLKLLDTDMLEFKDTQAYGEIHAMLNGDCEIPTNCKESVR